MADPTPEPAATKKVPYRFSHAQIATMVKTAARPELAPTGILVALQGEFPEAPVDAINAKLIELGIIDKPQKLELTQAETDKLDHVCKSLLSSTDNAEKRVLFARHVIKTLRTALPKREQKPEAS